MKNNVIIISLRNSFFITLIVMLGITSLYSFTDVSANEFRTASGETVNGNQGFLVRFINGGIYSDVHNHYINDRVFSALLFSFFFTGSSLILTIIFSIHFFLAVIYLPVRFFSAVKSVIVLQNFLPSYIIQIIFVSVFCFIMTVFPVHYSGGNVYSLVFPLLQLMFLFIVHTLFVLIQNLTKSDIMLLNYRLKLHRLSLVKQIQFVFLSEKHRLWFAVQSLLPLVIAGHIYTELIFSLPGYSRMIFTSIREFDRNVVICLIGILTFLYSLIYFITEPKNE